MEETTFHPLDYVSVLRRRAWWFIVPLVVAIAVGAALAAYLPKEYQATATVGVTTPAVSQDILGNATRLLPEERQRAISQQLASDVLLRRVATEEGLDKGRTLDQAVGYIRGGISVTIPPAQGEKGIDTFQVSFTDQSPAVAERVANRLASVFVSETSRARTTRAEDTTAFIDAQLRASKDRLQALETRLRDSKEAFMGSLPEQTDANLRMVASLQQQLQSNATALRSEQDRLSMVEQQLQVLQQGSAAPADGAVPAAAGDPAQTAAIRVLAAERALEAAQASYTEKHPEVQRLKEELATAKAAAAAEKQRPPADRIATLRLDPTYRALTTERDRSRLRINELQSIETNTRTQIAMYQRRVEAAPRIEQQFASLQREYDLEKGQYGELTQKRHSAELTQNLEQSAGGEKFAVLRPAGLPADPSKPNIPRLLLLAIVAGLVLGMGFAAGREYLDRAVYDARTLQREYALPVLGEIPRIA